MKIIFITSSYLPVLGGLQEAVYQLAKELKAAGYDITVVTNRYPRNLKRHEIIDDISVRRMLFPGWYLSSLRPERIVQFLAGLIIGTVNSFRLLFLMAKRRPDVVNIHFLGSQAPYAMLAAKILGIRCVVSLHGDDVEGLPHRSKIDSGLFRKVLIASDHVTACSEYLLTRAKKLVPEIEAKSTAIHNGIRLEEFQNVLPYEHAVPYIFAAGRFVHKKGFDVLLSAYRVALDKGLRADLILAGDGAEKKKLINLAVDLGLSFMERENNREWSDGGKGTTNKIIFWGRAQSREMKSLMKGCELFVIPSRREPFGIIALEAFAAGKKVVACRTGGLPEIVHEGEGSRLVNPKDSEAMAQGILLAMGDKAENVVRDMKGRSWKAVAKRYLDIFTRREGTQSRHSREGGNPDTN